MPRMANDSDVAQARILLSALNDHIARISGLLEKAERRSPAKYGPQEWPAGTRIIARRERPHPGAQLRLTDHNGWRITCFATNTRGIGWDACPLHTPQPHNAPPATPAASAGRWPPSKSAIANAPAPKTASAASKTLVCAICPSTAITPTGSG